MGGGCLGGCSGTPVDGRAEKDNPLSAPTVYKGLWAIELKDVWRRFGIHAAQAELWFLITAVKPAEISAWWSLQGLLLMRALRLRQSDRHSFTFPLRVSCREMGFQTALSSTIKCP